MPAYSCRPPSPGIWASGNSLAITLSSVARRGGAQGQLTVRADSECYARVIVAVCPGMDVRLSITTRQHKSLRNIIEAILN